MFQFFTVSINNMRNYKCGLTLHFTGAQRSGASACKCLVRFHHYQSLVL